MSDPPFTRNERTIIRPNPGGRRPSSSPTAPSAQPPQYPPPGTMPMPPAGGPGAGNPDDWVRTQPAPPPADAPQQALILKRDVPVAANENVLLEAAG